MSTFDLTVVSDPTAVRPNTRLWDNDLTALAQYDADLLKPALLFADSVTLLTFRDELTRMAEAHMLHAMYQGIPQIYRLLGISARRNPEELQFYGLREEMLPSKEDAMALVRQELNIEEVMPLFDKFVERYGEAILAYQKSIVKISQERITLLKSGEILAAEESGFLRTSGWRSGSEGSDLVWIGISGDEEYMLQALLDVEETVVAHDGPLMLEPGSKQMLRHGLDLSKLDDRPADASAIAVSAFGRLPGLQNAPIAEILDLREDLSDHLPAFRGAILDLADEISSHGDLTPTAMADKIDKQWHQHINPALMDIKSKLKRGRYRRHLLDEFGSKEGALAATASAALAIGGGSVAGGIAALVPAVAAGAFPLTKALSAALNDRDDARQNRLYFLYEAQRRLSTRRRRGTA